MKRLALTLLLGTIMVSGLSAQEKTKQKTEKKKKLRFDLSYEYDPRELQEHWLRTNRWKRIKGIVGIGAYHIHPAAEPGPYLGPPHRIWGQGFGTSLWRDPVTGRPIL